MVFLFFLYENKGNNFIQFLLLLLLCLLKTKVRQINFCLMIPEIIIGHVNVYDTPIATKRFFLIQVFFYLKSTARFVVHSKFLLPNFIIFVIKKIRSHKSCVWWGKTTKNTILWLNSVHNEFIIHNEALSQYMLHWSYDTIENSINLLCSFFFLSFWDINNKKKPTKKLQF